VAAFTLRLEPDLAALLAAFPCEQVQVSLVLAAISRLQLGGLLAETVEAFSCRQGRHRQPKETQDRFQLSQGARRAHSPARAVL
jgi:hypothetical protein